MKQILICQILSVSIHSLATWMLKTQPWHTIRRWTWDHFSPEADQELPTQNMSEEFALCPRTLILKWQWSFVHWYSQRLVIPSLGKKNQKWGSWDFGEDTVYCAALFTWAGIAYICTLAVCDFCKHWSSLSFAHRNSLGIWTLSLQTGSLTFYIMINNTVAKHCPLVFILST